MIAAATRGRTEQVPLLVSLAAAQQSPCSCRVHSLQSRAAVVLQ